jgi:quercetin dioxygenase-like cupin family protein
MANAVPIIRQKDEGEQLWFAGGGVWTLKASAAETAEAFMLLEFRAERGKVTPLHLHPDEDEGFYVLEGEVLVHVEGEEHRVGEGGVFIAPRGTPHALMVTSETVRFLSWQTPGTGEAFYREVTEPIRSPEDISRPPDWDRLREAAERSPTIELLGPPPFAAARQQADDAVPA